MHTKSRKQLNEQFSNMTAPEAFRACLKAVEGHNDDLLKQFRKLFTSEVKKDINHYSSNFIKKTNLYSSYLIIKATIAIGFYQYLIKLLINGQVSKELFDPEIAFSMLEQSQEIKRRIDEIDKVTSGVLKIEHFDSMEELANQFDSWLNASEYLNEYIKTYEKK